MASYDEHQLKKLSTEELAELNWTHKESGPLRLAIRREFGRRDRRWSEANAWAAIVTAAFCAFAAGVAITFELVSRISHG